MSGSVVPALIIWGVSLPDWLVLAAWPGHVSWLLWIDNRVHATAWDYHAIKLVGTVLKVAIFAGTFFVAFWAIAWICGYRVDRDWPQWWHAYVLACTVISIFGTLPWLVQRPRARDADVLLSDQSRRVDLRPTLGAPLDVNPYVRFASSVPGSQMLSIAVHEKRLRIPRLPAALDGLRIVHLSDVHVTGRIGKPFYERIVELANEAEADLVALTGDLIETEACWDWITGTFGRLRARHGAYFVFGNHDVRIDASESRRRLEAAGLVDLGGRTANVVVRGTAVLLAGNERPWIKRATDAAPLPPRDAREGLRILLSHSPDQYAWARERDFDLMLAGHVHGGQIQIPPIGPILAPSWFGVRYASGVFHEPPTVLHVSRGSSSKTPWRFFCMPELAVLTLTGPHRSGHIAGPSGTGAAGGIE